MIPDNVWSILLHAIRNPRQGYLQSGHGLMMIIVLRGCLGVIISDMNGEKAKLLGIGTTTGVLVDSLEPTGAAIKAGIQKDDVIEKNDNHYIETGPQFREMVALHHPGEKLRVAIIRNEKKLENIMN